MSIEVRNLHKKFGNFVALDNVNLKVEDGELLVLLGPSGCGKTTLLRIMAGLDQPDSGEVLIDNASTNGISPRDRNVGFVFQHYALFRHMSVFDNVAFGLDVRPKAERPSKKEIRERVETLLNLVQLDWALDRYPAQLSGGQRQRVALARALAVEPKVLLLDEPFGALDAKVRRELRRWLRHLHEDLAITSILVTHDQEEALEVADRVVVMNKAHIAQIGTPEEIYGNPADPFVCTFIGSVNLFRARLRPHGAEIGGSVHAAAPELLKAGDEAVAFVRPHDIEVNRHSGAGFTLPARLCEARVMGPSARLWLETGQGQPVEAELSLDTFRDLDLRAGEDVFLKLNNPQMFQGDGI